MKKIYKNALIVTFIVNLLIFLALLAYFLLYLLPNILDIESKKKELQKNFKNYNTLLKEGFSYPEFKRYKEVQLNKYQKEILKKVDKDFFEENFKNNWKFGDYYTFLNSVERNIRWDLWEEYEKNKKNLSKVLPIYVDNNINIEWKITDFQFINNIEKLLHKYWIKTNSPIWIKNIQKVEWYNDKDLSNNIYYVSLPLEISTKKKNLVRFLQAVKWFWELKEEKWKIKFILNDDFNELVEVKSLELPNYIDNSITNDGKNLLDVIYYWDEANDKIKAKLVLNFYFRWLSSFRIKTMILNVVWPIDLVIKNLKQKENDSNKQEIESKIKNYKYSNYLETLKRVKKLKLKYKKNKFYLHKLEQFEKYLTKIWKDIKSITKQIKKWNNLVDAFNKAKKYSEIFKNINKKLDLLDK